MTCALYAQIEQLSENGPSFTEFPDYLGHSFFVLPTSLLPLLLFQNFHFLVEKTYEQKQKYKKTCEEYVFN